MAYLEFFSQERHVVQAVIPVALLNAFAQLPVAELFCRRKAEPPEQHIALRPRAA